MNYTSDWMFMQIIYVNESRAEAEGRHSNIWSKHVGESLKIYFCFTQILTFTVPLSNCKVKTSRPIIFKIQTKKTIGQWRSAWMQGPG